MAYSEKVLDHYNNPRNVGTMSQADPTVGTGMVGAPACGDVMKLQIKVGSAIASSSLLTTWVKGRTVQEAKDIKNIDIVEELNLPPVKIHCSVLAEDCIKSAINDYENKNKVHR